MRKKLTRYQKIVTALNLCYRKLKDNDDSGCAECRYAGNNCQARLLKSAHDYVQGMAKVAIPEMGSDYAGDVFWCGECGAEIQRDDAYCRMCGCEINWCEDKHGWQEWLDSQTDDWSDLIDDEDN